MARFVGIDIGSVTCKGVVVNDGEVETSLIIASGLNYREPVEKLSHWLETVLQPVDISKVAVTGYLQDRIFQGARQIADIRCCARGTNSLFPAVRTVIDVQGQSTQVIRVGEYGSAVNFAVSEKCASGSGRFLEIIANVLQIDLEELGPISLNSSLPVAFSTGCAVFGESEAISRVAEGIPTEDIIAGVHKALAEKIAALIKKVGLEEPCAFSGGGALNVGLIRSLEDKLGISLLIPNQPQTVNAIGAAIIAERDTKS